MATSRHIINVLIDLVLIFLILGFLGFIIFSKCNKEDPLYIQAPAVEEHFIGSVKLNNRLAVRFLVLKHCTESIANKNANQAVEVANIAASKGLRIKDIGTHLVNGEGPINRVVWSSKKVSLSNLKEFLCKQMKVDAVLGDTLLIYTCGHGSNSGFMAEFGERNVIGKIFAEAAGECKQETLWWQSSCYAASGLPKISNMPENQQKLFAMIASSPANKVTYWGDQIDPMKKVLTAIAEESPDIDPNQDQVIEAGELRSFMNNHVKSGSGNLLFARAEDEPIFGWRDYANEIPIYQGGKKIKMPENYIPHPNYRVSHG